MPEEVVITEDILKSLIIKHYKKVAAGFKVSSIKFVIDCGELLVKTTLEETKRVKK
jgi:hypothetical protein